MSTNSSNKRPQGYIPDPLEAEALKALHREWRYYPSKKEFDAVIAELSEPVEGMNVSRYEAARFNTLDALAHKENISIELYSDKAKKTPVKSVAELTPEIISRAEKALRSDKKLWSDIQAVHLFNSIKTYQETPLDENMPDAKTVSEELSGYIDRLAEKRKAHPKSKTFRTDQRHIVNVLKNYGIEITETPTAEELKEGILTVMKRKNYLTPLKSEKQQKPKKNEDKKMTDTNETTGLASVTEEPYVMNDTAKDALKNFGYEGDGSEIKSKDDYLKTLAKCFHDRLKENQQNPEVSGKLCQDFARTVNSGGFRAYPKAIDTFMEMGLLDKGKGQAYYLEGDPSKVITPLRKLYENHPEQLKKFLEYNMEKYNESKGNKDEKKADGQEVVDNGEKSDKPEVKNEQQEQTDSHALGVTTFPAVINKQEEKTEEEKQKETPVAEETKTEEPIPEWIKRKAEWYQSQANQGNISGYEWHKEQKDCFAASVEGSEIHYDNPDNVKVSDDASYKVFDAIMKEEDNKGRPINFPENASKEVATRLYAACVMNGNPMQGAVPKELDEAALQSCGLSAEQVAKVKEQFAQNNGQQQQPEQKKEQPQISEAAKQEMNELGNEIVELQKAGKIKIKKSEDKKVEFLRGDNGNDNDVKTAQDKWNTISKIKETGLSSRQQAFADLRKRVADKGDTEIQGKLMDKQKMRDLIHAKRLGLTSESVKDHKGNEVQTLSGDRKQSYAQKLSNETKARIGFKGNDGR